MSTRHVKPPTPLFLFFLPVPRFSCSTAPQGFSRPDRVLSQAGARRVCQGWPLFSGHRQGSAFTRPSTTAGLMGRVDYTPISYLARLRVGGGVIVFRSRMLFFGRSCYEVHGACDSRINLYPAAPIRLAKVLLAWTIAQVDGAHLRNGILASANLRCGSTATHPTCPTHQIRGVGTQRVIA
jgi:hypothetical protein